MSHNVVTYAYNFRKRLHKDWIFFYYPNHQYHLLRLHYLPFHLFHFHTLSSLMILWISFSYMHCITFYVWLLTVYYLQQIVDQLPDLEMVVNTRDWPQVNYRFGQKIPVFSFSKVVLNFPKIYYVSCIYTLHSFNYYWEYWCFSTRNCCYTAVRIVFLAFWDVFCILFFV